MRCPEAADVRHDATECDECRDLEYRAKFMEALDRDLKSVDEVNRPSHYTQGEIECIDAIRAALTPEEFRGYCKGAAFKYIWRERYKGQGVSLAKAEWYLKQAVEHGD